MYVNLKALRTEKGWTQPEAAKQIGISLDYVKKIESCGKIPSLKVLKKIAVVFGRDKIDDILLAS